VPINSKRRNSQYENGKISGEPSKISLWISKPKDNNNQRKTFANNFPLLRHPRLSCRSEEEEGKRGPGLSHFIYQFSFYVHTSNCEYWISFLSCWNKVIERYQPLPRYNVQQDIKFTLYLDNRSPYPFVYFNLRNPYPFICLKPENWYPFFGRDLLVYAIIMHMGTALSRSG